MADLIIRRPVTAEARVRSQASPCGICGRQSDTVTGFPPRTSNFCCQCHLINAQYVFIFNRDVLPPGYNPIAVNKYINIILAVERVDKQQT
jgi:hypothetical protein